jgi:transcriptional regulator with XRE-family HTH domain
MAHVNELDAYLADREMDPDFRQKDFAKEAGISEPMLSLYRYGRRRPGLAAAVGIEQASGGRVKAAHWPHVPRRFRLAGNVA